MNQVTTIRLNSQSGDIIDDIQLWTDDSVSAKELPKIIPTSQLFESPRYIKITSIPLYLSFGKPLTVFSSHEDTNIYFKQHLLKFSLLENNNSLGLLVQANPNIYIVFYFERESEKIMVLILNIGNLNKLDYMMVGDSNSKLEIPKTKRIPPSPMTTKIFDKVLEKKKLKPNPFLVSSSQSSHASSPSLSILSTQEQINTAINKIILSGLRIRGLSANMVDSFNDKLTIKEIHQMTYKATLFALRKYNYTFNKINSGPTKKSPIRLNDLQAIVENLLELFVDLEGPLI
ncbi:Mitochondrial morphogenesis protein SLD7 [Spathaspora sp. JA1]|nr:Mitochondrial morphogenesis protein SLD7 [Spathaspora sp. JA1]